MSEGIENISDEGESSSLLNHQNPYSKRENDDPETALCCNW